MNRLDTHRVVSIDEIERRIRERPPLREPVHVRIKPALPLWEIAFCLLVAAGIGALLAIGGF